MVDTKRCFFYVNWMIKTAVEKKKHSKHREEADY